MVDCMMCGKEVKGEKIECSICKAVMHRGCAKKISGRYYCKQCYKEGKKRARYERMVQRAMIGKKLPKKLW